MTTDLAKARARRAGALVIIALATASVAAVSVAIEARSRNPQAAAGPVLPNYGAQAADMQRIAVVSREGRYEIEKTPKGWFLKGRDYPVKAERLGQFVTGLQALRRVRPMTRDPEKHDRIGLGDPTKQGSGVLVQVFNSRGAPIVDLIIGGRPGGSLFVREPEQNQTWQVAGDLPPLRDPAQWLDLVPLELEAARIASVSVTPASGPSYRVTRAEPGGRYELAPPHAGLQPIAPMGLRGPAEALARLNPTDVRPAAAIAGPAIAKVRLETFEGLAVEGDLFRDQGKAWLKLVARSDAPERGEEVTAINKRAAPWAYGLSDADARGVAPPLSELVNAPT